MTVKGKELFTGCQVKKKRAGQFRPARFGLSDGSDYYWQSGTPSFVEPPPSVREQVFVVEPWVAEASQPVAVLLLIVTVTPVEGL